MNAQTSGKKVVGRNVAIALGIICILLAVGLVGAIAIYPPMIANQSREISALTSENSQLKSQIVEKNNTISSLNSQKSDLQTQVNTLTSQVASLNSQVSSLQSHITSQNSQITNLQNQVSTLEAHGTYMIRLDTLVYHVCEKETIHAPDINYIYQQILTLNNNTYNILLLPEYNTNENWTEELAWLTANFGGRNGIPIMLGIFGGGSGHTPVQMLSTAEISAAMAVCNVRWLAIGELISWYMGEPSLPFPTDYISTILNFCRANDLKLFWTEWKVNNGVFQTIQTYIAGFEDIVTVSFSTNSGDLEPAEGFTMISKMFQHWGGSVQAWYWTTRYGSDPLNMPASLLLEHALSAKNMGAEVIEFEPYGYFFDNGEVRESLRILQTLFAELH